MAGTNEALRNRIESQFLADLAFKAFNWTAITAGVAIEQDNLAGIVITGGGTCVLIGSDQTSELDLGTVVADTTTILPFCPYKVKTGSTATVYAMYGA